METKIFTTPNWESSPNGNLVWQHFSVSILDFEAFVHKWAEDLQNITFSGFNNNVQFTTEDILDTLRISTEVYLLFVIILLNLMVFVLSDIKLKSK